jgi:uncharacterized damage-inducible protein DinB
MSISPCDACLLHLDFFRERTLGTLAAIEQMPDPQKVLGWRPGPGRAHIAWQLTHIGITEELFATERFLGTAPAFADLVPRFRGGSKPDDNIPAAATIREVLNATREHLRQTIGSLTEADLERIPPALKERGITIARALKILPWHEAHHQGQAHLTLNLHKASQ